MQRYIISGSILNAEAHTILPTWSSLWIWLQESIIACIASTVKYLFPDNDKPINVNEYSAHLQASKKLFRKNWIWALLSVGIKTRSFPTKSYFKTFIRFEVDRNNYLCFSYQNGYSYPSNIQALQTHSTDITVSPRRIRIICWIMFINLINILAHTLGSVQKYQQTITSVLKDFIMMALKTSVCKCFELGYATVISKIINDWCAGILCNLEKFYQVCLGGQPTGTSDVTAFKDQSKHIVYIILLSTAPKLWLCCQCRRRFPKPDLRPTAILDHINNKNNTR